MSFYTIFQNVEPFASSTTTSVTLASSDPVLAFSLGSNKSYQTTVGSVAGQSQVTNVTTANFGQSVTPFGITIATAGTTAGMCLIPAPGQAGLYKTLMMSATSTTTGFLFICNSTATVVFTTGSSTNTVKFWQTIALGQNSAYIDLVSISSASWQAIGASLSPSVAFTSTTST